MDMSLRTLDNIEGPNGIQRIQEAFSFGKKFARYMNVEERMLDALTALWLLDCGVELTRAVGLLLRPNVQLEPSWPMSVIKALADHRVEASDAFKYYTALRPKLRTMDDALLIIRVFLQNNLWQQYRDEASWAYTTSENVDQRNFNLAMTILGQQFAVELFEAEAEGASAQATGALMGDLFKSVFDKVLTKL